MTVSVTGHFDVKSAVGSIEISLVEAISTVPGIVAENTAFLITLKLHQLIPFSIPKGIIVYTKYYTLSANNLTQICFPL